MKHQLSSTTFAASILFFYRTYAARLRSHLEALKHYDDGIKYGEALIALETIFFILLFN